MEESNQINEVCDHMYDVKSNLYLQGMFRVSSILIVILKFWDIEMKTVNIQGSPKSLPHKLVTSLNKLSMLGPKVKGDNSHLLVISEVSFQVRLLRSGVNLFEEFY